MAAHMINDLDKDVHISSTYVGVCGYLINFVMKRQAVKVCLYQWKQRMSCSISGVKVRNKLETYTLSRVVQYNAGKRVEYKIEPL
jgi:hypothetical protein